MNTRLSPEKRAHLVASAMTLSEKLSMVHGEGGAINAIPRLCLPELLFVDGGAGVGDLNTGVTAWPAPESQAAEFDRTTVHKFGVAVADELRGKGGNVWLAPDVNIARWPLNGRTFEQYGEDPYLSGETAAAVIRGAQSQHVIAVVKHYVGNESETNRNYVDSEIDDRTLHEIYLAPFQAAVEQGHVGGVMCAYNRLNGVYSCSNRTLLTTDLKQRMGFKGFVVSDWIAAAHFPTDANAGLDIEMPFQLAFTTLQAAVATGIVPMSRLNNMVYRTLWAEFTLGVVDHPVGTPKKIVATPAHLKLARQMVADGSVLLKNDGQMFPLTRRHSTIAVIGPVGPGGAGNVCSAGESANVDCANSQSAEASLVNGTHGPDALTAIRNRARRNGDTILFADGSNLADVTAVARKADYVIAFGYYTETEGQDRSTLKLDGNGNSYISAAATANRHTAVILEAGGPVTMPWLANVRTVLDVWYPGIEGPLGIADMVFGDQSPGGRLPLTFPISVADLPTAGQPLREFGGISPVEVFSEKLDVGYRWYDAKHITPLFPFGYGLTYTRFEYSGLSVHRAGRSLQLRFLVRNVGDRTAAAVPEVYVADPATAGEPPVQLKGYVKTVLRPGQGREVTVRLGRQAFRYWSAVHGDWVVAPGCYRIIVGTSSRSPLMQADRTPAGSRCSSEGTIP